MPTVMRAGPFRFYFYSNENDEPPHVHVDRDESSAEFWLQPVRLASHHGFLRVELRRVEKIVVEHSAHLIEAWNEHHGTEGW